MKNLKILIRKGFSLIELMIVIVLIFILVSITGSIYSNYTLRAKIIDSIGKIGNIKTQISECLNSGCDLSGMNFTDIPVGISVINGSSNEATIEIDMSQTSPDTFSSENDIIRFQGSVNNNAIVQWVCSYNSNASGLTTSNLPTNCHNTFSNINIVPEGFGGGPVVINTNQ